MNQEADAVRFSHLEFKLSHGYGYVWGPDWSFKKLGLCCMMFMAIEALLKRDCWQNMTRLSFRIEREEIL